MKRGLLFAILIACASVQIKAGLSMCSNGGDEEAIVNTLSPDGPIDTDWY